MFVPKCSIMLLITENGRKASCSSRCSGGSCRPGATAPRLGAAGSASPTSAAPLLPSDSPKQQKAQQPLANSPSQQHPSVLRSRSRGTRASGDLSIPGVSHTLGVSVLLPKRAGGSSSLWHEYSRYIVSTLWCHQTVLRISVLLQDNSDTTDNLS